VNKKILLILTGLAVLGFFLRSYLFPDNLFFGPEQGNDFKIIRDIVVSHKYTLIGPKTDIGGVFHGPIYYYLAVIPFFFSGGDPYIVALFFTLIQSLTVFLIYLVALEITGNSKIAYISASLYTVSYGAISYSRWLSGQPLTIPLSALFFLFLIKFLKGRKWYLPGAAISYGLMGQSEFINFLLVAATGLGIFICYYKKIIRRSKIIPIIIISLCTAILFSVGNFALFDIRHKFLISKSLFALCTGVKGYYTSFSQSFNSVTSTFIDSSMDVLGLPNTIITIAILASIFTILFIRSKKSQYLHLLLLWLLIPNIILIILRHGALVQLYVFLAVGLLLGMAYAVYVIYEKFSASLGIFVFLLIIFSNVSLWFMNLPTNKRIFFQSTQPDLHYQDQLGTIEYIYKKAQGRQFYFQSYTIPYFWQSGWEYLFWYYGTKHNYILPDEEHDQLLYVIIQKDISNPRFQFDWHKNTVEHWGTLQTSASFGTLTVEERIKER